tara:strand:+ start:11031 stop:13901 length:2871 start_codon:yes stop_codon:yes gene_type:complete
MPPAVGAVAASVIASVAKAKILAVAISWKVVMAKALITGAISMIASAVMGGAKPKAPDFGTGAITSRERDRTLTVRQAIAPHRVIYGETRVGGIITFLHSTDDNEMMHQLVTIAGHEVNSIGQIYLDDLPVTVTSNTVSDTKYKDFVDIYNGTGSTSGDSSLLSTLSSNTSNKWSSNHKQEGRAKIYIRLKYDADTFTSGMPNVTAVVQGKKVYDPRDASTAYSNNPALCIRDYLTSSQYGLGEPSARINDTSFNAAANICDENVSLNGGGTEKRYTLNGTFTTDETPKEIIKTLLASCAGRLTYQGGEWNLYAGAYSTPTISFDESDLDGGIQVTTQVSRRELFNSCRGIYIEPGNLYQPVDFPVVENSTYKTNDQGDAIWRDFDFKFVTSSATAQRLAKIELEKVRQQITVAMPVNMKGLQVQAGDHVSISNTRMGWTDKVFIVEEWSLALRSGEGDPRIGVDLFLRETASTVYDWNSSEETTVDASPDTDLPDPFTAQPPTSLAQTESLYVTTNGSGVKVRASLSWTASADSFAQDYITEYKLSSSSDWIIGQRVPASILTVNIDDIATGTYDFRVKAINTLGVSSTYTTLTSKKISGLTANPADVTGLSVVALNNQAHISWDLHPDLDVRHGGKIRFRHSNLTDGTARWESSTDIGAAVAGHNTDTALPLLSGTYMARAVDSTDNESLTETSFVITTVPDITKMNAVTTVNAHPDFAGTVTGLDIVDGLVKFESVSDFDDRTALLDTWTFFDSYTSGVDTSGTYEFDGVDLGAVYTSRLTHSITFNTFEIGDYLDSRSGNVDDYVDWDNPPAGLNLDLYVATTNDQVSGSPTWGAWTKFKVGDFTARGFKFKLTATSTDADHQFNLTALGITIDMPDQVQGEKDIESGSSTKSVTFPSAFYAIPSIGITANNMGSGDYYTVANKSKTGFDITFYNSSASAVDRNFNYQARGY